LDDRLRGYEVGADQYLVKPTDLRELAAVLKAIYARLPAVDSAWQVDVLGWRIRAPDGKQAGLTRSEVMVLKALAARPGVTVLRDQIVEGLGYKPIDYDPRRLEIMIRRLRNKVAEETGRQLPISTVHGQGYAFTARISIT
jgi:DNA-binding response OmpR family regulator